MEVDGTTLGVGLAILATLIGPKADGEQTASIALARPDRAPPGSESTPVRARMIWSMDLSP